MQLAVRVGLVARRRLEAARPERGLAGLARRQYASILVLLVLPTHRHLNAVTLQAAPAVRGGLFQRQFFVVFAQSHELFRAWRYRNGPTASMTL